MPRADYLGYGLGVMLAGILALVVLSAGEKHSDRRPVNEAIFARDILFSDRVDGGISIRDASTGQMIGEISPGEGGFVRGALRGFARERRLQNPGMESPLRLAAVQGGAIVLEAGAGRICGPLARQTRKALRISFSKKMRKANERNNRKAAGKTLRCTLCR